MANKEHHLKEWTEIQRVRAENKKLRRQIGKLRKVISRIDFEEYEHIRDLIEAQQRQNEEFTKEMQQKRLDDKWKCWDCEEGILKLITIFKGGEPYYLRKCTECEKKTKLQKYTEEVEGIK